MIYSEVPIERMMNGNKVTPMEFCCNNCSREYFAEEGTWHCHHMECDYDICETMCGAELCLVKPKKAKMIPASMAKKKEEADDGLALTTCP